MKIWAFSDLHLTTHAPLDLVLGGVPDADVCVVAGDLFEGDAVAAVHWLAEHVRPHMPVIMVLGNHEFYQHVGQDRVRQQAQAAAWHAGIHLLDDTGVDIGGVRFLGSTLWSDFDVHGGGDEVARAYAMNAVTHSMRDYNYPAIDGQFGRWSPSLARRQHLQSRQWLETELAGAELPVVVVTHHAPAPGSIAVEFERDLATGAFVSDLTDMIERHQPRLWLHGHTHTSFDYQVGETRVVCNPHGYGRENERRFDPAMVIESDEYRPRPPGV